MRTSAPYWYWFLRMCFEYASMSVVAPVSGVDETSLCPSGCECFDEFQTVDCAKRGFLSLPVLLNHTKRLSLEGNHLQTITVDSFRFAAEIESIILTDNNLVLMNTIAFCHLDRLGELDLSRNFIRVFDVESSCGAAALEELNLSHNQLMVLPRALASFAPSLEVLDLSHNSLATVQFDASYGRLRALRFLDLSSNHLEEIRGKYLEPLRTTSLQTICFNDCQIQTMDPDSLMELQNLTTLSMSNSRLSEASIERLFQGISAPGVLTQLDLSQTPISDASVSLLGSFQALSLLDLSNCNLRRFDSLLFRHLPDLESLHLDGGGLTYVADVGMLKNLRELFVQRNLLDAIDLRRTKVLETIDLSWNRFRILPSKWLDSADMIQDLNLSHNLISTIDQNAFDLINIVYIIDLSYNRLELLQSFGLLRVRKLILCHNNITRVVKGAFDSHFDTLMELDLGWNRLEEVEAGTFSSTLTALHYLNLAHNRLGVALARGQLKVMFSSMTFLKVLDLSFNDIEVIVPGQLVDLRQLSSLYLQGNKIHRLGDASLPDVNLITKVILSSNHLETVDMNVLGQLEFLQEIDLSGNPLLCDCHLTPFLTWINLTDVRVVSIYDHPPRYFCLSPVGDGQSPHPRQNISLLHFDSKCSPLTRIVDHHTQQTAILVGLIAVTAFVLLAVSLCWSRCWRRLNCCGRFGGEIRYREVSSIQSTDSHL